MTVKLSEAALTRLLMIGPSAAMKQDEIDAGNSIVLPGSVAWLPEADWRPDIVVSRLKHAPIVRIIAIKARRPGTGAFGRMITGICAAGLTPVVVEPMFDMPKILERWGWNRIPADTKFADEQWKPTAEWCAGRAALKESESRG